MCFAFSHAFPSLAYLPEAVARRARAMAASGIPPMWWISSRSSLPPSPAISFAHAHSYASVSCRVQTSRSFPVSSASWPSAPAAIFRAL